MWTSRPLVVATVEVENTMRAMWIGFALAIGIAAIAAVTLNHFGPSSAARFSTQDTRL